MQLLLLLSVIRTIFPQITRVILEGREAFNGKPLKIGEAGSFGGQVPFSSPNQQCENAE